MTARQLITEGIIPLKTSDTAAKALVWMDELKVSHFPIVNNEMLLGLISEHDIFEQNNLEEAIGNHSLSPVIYSVNEHQHIYEVLTLINDPGLTLIPVTDDNGKYLGSITLQGVLKFFCSTISVDNPGGVIVLEMTESNYNLTEIANIIESNSAKVLSTFLVSHPDSTLLELVIKINKIEFGAIINSFVRYGYVVKATFGEDESAEDIKERFDSLMNYLKM